MFGLRPARNGVSLSGAMLVVLLVSVAALIACLIGLDLAPGGSSMAATEGVPAAATAQEACGPAEAKFQGTSTTDQWDPWEYCGTWAVNVRIDEIIEDDCALLSQDEVITVFYNQLPGVGPGLEAGEMVEVLG